MKVTIEISDDKPAVTLQSDAQPNLAASTPNDAGMAAGQDSESAPLGATGTDASSNAGKPSDDTFAWMGRRGIPGNGTLEATIQVIDLGQAPDLQ